MRSRLAALGLAVVTAGPLMVMPLTARATDESRVRVEYQPPHVSVVAREVGLGELLRLIGAKVGFTVAEGRAASGPVTVSIASASVDDVLRQLLRAENHTILYRQGADVMVMVDRIVLLGAPAEGMSVADTGPRPSQDVPAVASSASGIGASPQTAEQQGSGGDMLQSHSIAGPPPQPAAVAEPAAPSMPPRTSVVEGQERATESLQQPAPSPATGR